MVDEKGRNIWTDGNRGVDGLDEREDADQVKEKRAIAEQHFKSDRMFSTIWS